MPSDNHLCYPNEDVSTELQCTIANHYEAVAEQNDTHYIYNDSDNNYLTDIFWTDFNDQVPAGRTITKITRITVEGYADRQDGDQNQQDEARIQVILDVTGVTTTTTANLTTTKTWYVRDYEADVTEKYSGDHWFRIRIALRRGYYWMWRNYFRLAYCYRVRVTVYYDYTAGYGHKVSGVAGSDIAKVNLVLGTDIEKINLV